ncbi:hypothetical protein MHH60_28340 [Paenibacillus sp. FSL H7-0716]|uniref:Uncharacterized protein n=1 Tax=Paenibacillus odorifer TaxID=189426 RepID=A0A1R0XY82_9BACL|nr:hypothetical protein [Paenibacillus odorifer]OMD40055.1 hypothetical protein BSK52_14265 [Paenibacillus odorifer]OME19829.1 hypothetical protein BSK47_14755 [Paenibacillus odorifer]
MKHGIVVCHVENGTSPMWFLILIRRLGCPKMMDERMIDMCRKETECGLCLDSRIGNGGAAYVVS